jgi:hypothetical protein
MFVSLKKISMIRQFHDHKIKRNCIFDLATLKPTVIDVEGGRAKQNISLGPLSLSLSPAHLTYFP